MPKSIFEHSIWEHVILTGGYRYPRVFWLVVAGSLVCPLLACCLLLRLSSTDVRREARAAGRAASRTAKLHTRLTMTIEQQQSEEIEGEEGGKGHTLLTSMRNRQNKRHTRLLSESPKTTEWTGQVGPLGGSADDDEGDDYIDEEGDVADVEALSEEEEAAPTALLPPPPVLATTPAAPL